MGRNNETILVRTIASEVHTVARQILHSTPQLENEGESLERGTKRLYAGEVAQWEQHMQDEETEVEEATMALLETGEATTLMEEESKAPGQTTTCRKRKKQTQAMMREQRGEHTAGHRP